MKKNSKQKKIIIFILAMIIIVGLVPGRTVAVKAAGSGGTPVIGQICLFPYNRTPLGWMECNGASLSVSEYSDLYAFIGNDYGGNNTVFNLPNLSTKAPIAGTKYYIAVEGSYGAHNSDPAIGEVCLFPDRVVMDDYWGWELCDGKTLSAAAYQPLYTLISTTYGGTATDFKIPNLMTKSPLNGMHYYIATMGLYPMESGGIGNDALLGSIELYAFSFIPGDSYFCNGQTVMKATNNALNSLINNTFGGSTTSFAIPDLSSAAPSFKMKYCMKKSGMYPYFD